MKHLKNIWPRDRAMRHRMPAIASRLGMILIAALLAGCAWQQGGSLPPAPSELAEMPVNTYIIGPGDTLDVLVWGNPEISRSVVVPPDGSINTPLVENVPAAGKTASDLADDLEERLSRYIRQPVVTVIVSGFVGPYSRQIRVLGEAAQPQALQYRQGMTLMDVMIAVGGLTEFADGNDARLIRTVDGERRQYSVELDDLVRDGDISANVEMRPGDVLIIPESFL